MSKNTIRKLKPYISNILHTNDLLTNMFSKDRFASQQLRNTGINRFLNGGNGN